MDFNTLLSQLVANGLADAGEVTQAIKQHDEQVLNSFIGLQFAGDKANAIEVNVSDDMQRRLFERVQQQWTKAGELEPYSSVLSDEKYTRKNIQANMEEFRRSGDNGMHQLVQLAKKNSVTVNSGSCLELGCGVGRMTAHFAKHFRSVLAVDISPANLSLCEQYAQELGLANVTPRLLTRLDELNFLPNVDVFVSFIAIQHNPPPIQQYILKRVLSKLNYGGVFLFQTIVHHPTYAYTAESNFNYPEHIHFEMHALPMRHVIKAITDCNLTLLDVVKDRMGGYGIDSNTFFGVNLNRDLL